MANAILKGCAKEVRNYAKSIGSPLTQAQTYEIIARARGFQNANVLAAQYEAQVPGNKLVATAGSVEVNGSISKTEPVIVSDVTLSDDGYQQATIMRLHRHELGSVGLCREYLKRRLSMVDNGVCEYLTIDVVLPLPIGKPITYRAISELLFHRCDAITHCDITMVNYPYGKHHQAYRVQARPYNFALPNPQGQRKRQARGDDLKSLLHTLAAEKESPFLVGYGFAELDWKTGKPSVAAMPDDATAGHLTEDTKYLHVLLKKLQGGGLWLTYGELRSLRHLVGCYYEVTQGLYEGLRIAFYE